MMMTLMHLTLYPILEQYLLVLMKQIHTMVSFSDHKVLHLEHHTDCLELQDTFERPHC